MASAAPLEDRFWSKVDQRSPDECWPWLGSISERGYGRFMLGGKVRRAHRVAWELAAGKPLSAACVCHSCDNPNCVNPAHLWPGTLRDNAQDMVRKRRHMNSRKTHCPRGHELSGTNAVPRADGRRQCRQCKLNYRANRLQRKVD